MPEDEIKSKSRDLISKYNNDLQEDLINELPTVFRKSILPTWDMNN